MQKYDAVCDNFQLLHVLSCKRFVDDVNEWMLSVEDVDDVLSPNVVKLLVVVQ